MYEYVRKSSDYYVDNFTSCCWPVIKYSKYVLIRKRKRKRIIENRIGVQANTNMQAFECCKLFEIIASSWSLSVHFKVHEAEEILVSTYVFIWLVLLGCGGDDTTSTSTSTSGDSTYLLVAFVASTSPQPVLLFMLLTRLNLNCLLALAFPLTRPPLRRVIRVLPTALQLFVFTRSNRYRAMLRLRVPTSSQKAKLSNPQNSIPYGPYLIASVSGSTVGGRGGDRYFILGWLV